jgi:hypothetical protein
MMPHGMLLQHFSSKPHSKESMGAAKTLVCRKIMEASEAKEHGGDSKQKHQVEVIEAECPIFR